MRLNNKLAVITAAASGMGRAGVELFVREGARVCAIDINPAALETLVREIDAPEGAIVTVVADLSKPEGMKASINEAAAKRGGIDILWAHAGIPGPGSVEGMDLAEYQLAMDLNVTSAVVQAGEVAQYMRQRGGGSVIFTASVAGLVGSMMSPVYSAAKFAVVGLTKSLAQRFAPDGIRVNVVCPGLTETPMKAGFVGRDNDPVKLAENEKKLLAAVPMGRFGEAHESAHAALWLASDDASYVTGVALPVDGGYTAR